jgi:hypothetical protein
MGVRVIVTMAVVVILFVLVVVTLVTSLGSHSGGWLVLACAAGCLCVVVVLHGVGMGRIWFGIRCGHKACFPVASIRNPVVTTMSSVFR